MRRFFALLALLTALLAFPCAAEETVLLGEDSGLFRAVLQDVPGLTPETDPQSRCSNPFSVLRGDSMLICLDVQALPAIEQGVGRQFLPQCLATVVFAVDRSQTDFLPHSWAELGSSPEKVGFAWDPVHERMAIAAAAFGLEGDLYNKESALDFYRQLRERSLLNSSSTSEPITICFDYEAAARIREGEALTVIVPRDGTLTFSLGLLSAGTPAGASSDALLREGMRLPDGRCDPALYPAAEDYAAVAPVPDLQHFLEETDRPCRDLRRESLNIRRFAPADGTEHILTMTLSMAVIAAWIPAALYRSPRREIRRGVLLIGALCIGWLMVVLLKYQLTDPFPVRMFWYAFYFFLLGLPLALLYVAIIFDRTDDRPLPVWFLGLLGLYAALVLLVFTNDLHQWVFRLVPGDVSYDAYSYGVGYFLCFAFCIAVFFAALALLFVKSRRSLRRYAILLPPAVAAMLLIYNIGYVLGIPLIRESNLAMVICLMAILFSEAVLNSGLLPTNTHYRELFVLSGLGMTLLRPDGETILCADGGALSPDLRQKVLAHPGETLQADENTLLHSRKISAGLVVWQEDLTAINRLRRRIEEQVQQLAGANALLAREGDLQRQKLSARIKEQLFLLLETDMEEQTLGLTRAIRELPDCDDRSRRLSFITLRLCYIKRRCNLFFLAQQGDHLRADDLAVYLDEFSEFAGYAGLQALVRCGLSGEVPVEAAMLCCDFYFTILSAVEAGASVIGMLEQTAAGPLFRVLSSAAIPESAFSASFTAAAGKAGAAVTFESSDEDGLLLSLCFSGKEAAHV